MAPSTMTNGNVGAKDSHRTKVRPAVVPAIPLPYLQQQQQRRNKTPVSPLPGTPGRLPSTPTSASVMTSPDTSVATSGTGELSSSKDMNSKESVSSGHSGHSKENNDVAPHAQEPAPLLNSDEDGWEDHTAPMLQGMQLLAMRQVAAAAAEHSSSQSQHSTAALPSPTELPVTMKPTAASPTSPTNFNPYDPEFWADYLAACSQPRESYPVPLPRPGPPAGHAAEGNIVFGGVQDSNNTSPAPHSGSGFPPPHLAPHQAYNFPTYDWRRFAPPAAMGANNGYPPMQPPPPPPPPPPPAFNPSSPQSFHGSQSSMHADETGAASWGPPDGMNAGHIHHNSEPAVVNAAVSRSMPMPPVITRSPEHLHEFLVQMQGSFENPEFADCKIEFHLRSRPFPSFTFQGHRAVLAGSPTLLQLFRQQQSSVYTRMHERVLTVTDPYVTVESLQLAFRAMYSNPMPDIPYYGCSPAVRDQAMTRALEFATTGILLGVPYISKHGFDAAERFIEWATVERALDYCLTGAINLNMAATKMLGDQYCPEATFKYGTMNEQPIRSLLDRISHYIAQNFPRGFVIDPTVQAPSYTRFPFADVPSPSPTPAPAIVHGSSSSGGANLRREADPRLSQIRFGDLSPPTASGGGGTHRDGKAPPPPPPQAAMDDDGYGGNLGVTSGSSDQPSSHPPRGPTPGFKVGQPAQDEVVRPILSRILLNLPFDYLRFVLNHPRLGYNDVAGVLTYEDRHILTRQILAQREAQRVRVLNEVITKRPKGWESIMARLGCDLPAVAGPTSDADVLGWKESVHRNSPELHRAWTPVRLPTA